MAFIFDHLIAILVGATLLGALLFIQHRGQQSAVENTIRHRAETQTASFLSTLTRDLENARTSRQITTGLGSWAPDSIGNWGNRAFGIYGTDTHTDRIELVTLADPDAGISSGLLAVGYEAVATGDSVTIGGVRQALYRVHRYVYEPGAADWVRRGGSNANLTRFSLRANTVDGSSTSDDRIGTPPVSVDIAITAAEAPVGQKTGDLAATTLTNATQQAITVRNVNATSTGDASAVAPPGGTVEIPRFPGISPPPPPPPPGTGNPGSPQGDDDDDDGGGGGGGGPGNTPPPPDFSGLDL
ncbi:MAG: hypothetical protein AAF170_00205 [Bacteroidota bacterium]